MYSSWLGFYWHWSGRVTVQFLCFNYFLSDIKKKLLSFANSLLTTDSIESLNAPNQVNYCCHGDAISLSCAAVIGYWSEWGTWSECSASCNGGTQTRTRNCAPINANCSGSNIQRRSCNESPCPLREWSWWWSGCGLMVHFLWVWLNGSFPVGVSPVLRFGNEVQFYVADVHVCKKCLPIILPTFVV